MTDYRFIGIDIQGDQPELLFGVGKRARYERLHLTRKDAYEVIGKLGLYLYRSGPES